MAEPVKEPETPKTSWADLVEEDDKKKDEVSTVTDKLALVQTQDDAPLEIKAGRLVDELLDENEIEVFNSNPNSPLYSVKSFEDLKLRPELIKGVYALGFEKPSKIQERALPLILSDPPQNLIAQAQSGTGKTAAFALGMLSRVDTSLKYTQAICASPIRELSRQIAENVELMGQFMPGLVVSVAIPTDKTAAMPKLTGHVIIGTPGTLILLIAKRLIDVKHVKVLVLDEADNMLEQGALRDQSIKLQRALPKTVQTLCFSATYEPTIFKFAERIVSDGGKRQYGKITLKVSELSLETVRQFFIDVGSESNKFNVLTQIFGFIKVGGQTIIFISRKDKAEEVQNLLIKEKYTVSLLTSNMSGAERDEVIDNYRAGKSKILLSTNALARGIDILQIALVINYDLPVKFENGRSTGEVDIETYLHRCGRSARYGRPGVVINFVHDQQSRQQVMSLQKLKPIDEMAEEDIPELEGVMKKLRK